MSADHPAIAQCVSELLEHAWRDAQHRRWHSSIVPEMVRYTPRADDLFTCTIRGFVACDDDRYAGRFSFAYRSDEQGVPCDETLQLKYANIEPQYRGLGAMRALLKHIIDPARRLGFTRMSVACELDGSHVWPRLGFELDAKSSYYSMDEQRKIIVRALQCFARRCQRGYEPYSRGAVEQAIKPILARLQKSESQSLGEIASLHVDGHDIGKRILYDTMFDVAADLEDLKRTLDSIERHRTRPQLNDAAVGAQTAPHNPAQIR